MSKFSKYRNNLNELKKISLLRELRNVESSSANRIVIDGVDYLNLSSNNYLGLTTNRRVIEQSGNALRKYGAGSGSARLISGNFSLNKRLEERIAAFKGAEAALVFSTGYMANLGIISALMELEPDGVILLDRLCHASIVDGCSLSHAKFRRFKHNDMDHLGRMAKNDNVKLVITEGVFSMDGDIGDLPGIIESAGDQLIMVDDAHATGVLGSKGSGSAEYFGLSGKVDIHMGTLGKAIGSFGAYVAGERDLIDYIINRARSFIFTTALPPAVLAGAHAAIDIIEEEPGLRKTLLDKSRYFCESLKEMGFVVAGSKSPIVPIVIGSSSDALKFAEELLDNGIFAPAVRPPTVPEGTSRIRFTIMATHTDEQLKVALGKIGDIGKNLGVLD